MCVLGSDLNEGMQEGIVDAWVFRIFGVFGDGFLFGRGEKGRWRLWMKIDDRGTCIN